MEQQLGLSGIGYSLEKKTFHFPLVKITRHELKVVNITYLDSVSVKYSVAFFLKPHPLNKCYRICISIYIRSLYITTTVSPTCGLLPPSQ